MAHPLSGIFPARLSFATRHAFRGVTLCSILLCSTALLAQNPPKKTKPQRLEQLDDGISLQRDPSTGELHITERLAASAPGPNDAPPAPHALRIRVNLVPINCNVFAADGSAVDGLARDDFRIYQDGIEQLVSYFDAATEPASVALVIDASPSEFPDEQPEHTAARELAATLAPRDAVAVVEFSAHSFILAPFSSDRDELERVIKRIDVRGLFGDRGGSNIYETIYLTAEKLFRDRHGRKAILLLTDGQDSGLGLSLDRAAAPAPAPSPIPPATPAIKSSPAPAAPPKNAKSPAPAPSPTHTARPATDPGTKLTFDDVARALAADGVEVDIVSTQNRPHVMTDDWLAARSGETLLTEKTRDLGIPAYTLFLAELVRRAGGGLYFLRETQSGRDAFERIAANIRSQYTLGFYPAGENAASPGWHSLRIEVVPRQDAAPVRVVHRGTYYVPASPAK
jgi:VWFA-related protein